MKKLYLIICLAICLLLTGCGDNIDLSKYDKIALTKDNISNYLDAIRLSGSYDNKTVELTLKFESENQNYIFEDVSFDAQIIDCYKYNLLIGIEGSDNIYVDRNRISIDKNGNSSEFTIRQSVSNQIVRLCSSSSELFTADNVKGYIYIPWDE